MFFSFVFCCLCFWCLPGFADGDSVRLVSVIEGESVTLHTDNELQMDDVIMWRFGPQNSLIAKVNKGAGRFTVYDDVLDGRFRDRLKVDHQTGSLTITNITSTDAGDYQLRRKTIYRFSVTVYARLPVPVISNNASSSYCSLQCSVVNVSHVTLSWYKGNSLLSSIISVSDLNNSISLHLVIECLNDAYSCVVAYSFTNQTTHLTTELCQPCQDSVHCCGFTEAVVRLALSTLVGVATVSVLVYDIRPRKDDQQRR